MTEQINIRTESIFSKYPSTAIAAMCALAHFTSDEAYFIVVFWEELEVYNETLADFRKVPDRKEALSNFLWAVEGLAHAVTGLPERLLTFNIEKADPYATGKRFIDALAPEQGEMPDGLLRQEEASEYLSGQFSACEVAYAAAYAELDYEYVVDVWRALGDDDAELEDVLCAMVDLFGDDVPVQGTADGLAEFFLVSLSLIK